MGLVNNSFSYTSFQITSCFFCGNFSFIVKSTCWVPPSFVPLNIPHLRVFHFPPRFSTYLLAPFLSVSSPPLFFLLFTALYLATEKYTAGCQDKPELRQPRSGAPSTTQTQTPLPTLGWGEKNQQPTLRTPLEDREWARCTIERKCVIRTGIEPDGPAPLQCHWSKPARSWVDPQFTDVTVSA